MGGEHVRAGLTWFDRERRNIETGQAWAADRTADDAGAARLCVRYPDTGASCARPSPASAPTNRLAGNGHRRPRGRSGTVVARASAGEFRQCLCCPRRRLAGPSRTMSRCLAMRGRDRRPSPRGHSVGQSRSCLCGLGETPPRRCIMIELFNSQSHATPSDRRHEATALGNLGIAYATPRRAPPRHYVVRATTR